MMHSTEVTFPSGSLALTGTLVRPAGTAPFPTALLIPGSGPVDRDSNHRRIRLNVTHDLAVVLAEAGWASLRFDKRGVGASEGDYLSTGFFDAFADVEAARDFLLGREDVAQVIAIGHSEGAMHAIELAGQEPAIGGAVLLAASAKTGEETLRWQARQIGDHLLPRPIRALMRLFRTDVLKQQDKAIARLKATTTDTARIQLAKVNAKWMREFMAYDPVPDIRAASAPLLAITGSKDVQVDPADLAVVAREAPNASVLEIDGVDHILRFEPKAISNPRHYGRQVGKPIDPRVVEAVVGWISELSSGTPHTGPATDA